MRVVIKNSNKRHIFYYLFLMASVLVSCAQNNSGDKCQNFNNEYPGFLKIMSARDDTMAMIKKLDEILLKDSYCIDAALTQGDLYLSLDSLNKAAKIFSRISLLDTSNVYALYRLGITYQLAGMNDVAVIAFQKAINLKSHASSAITDYMPAANGNTDLSKYDVTGVELMYRQGVSSYYQRNLQAAFDNFNFCISNNYLLETVYLYRGSVYYESNQKEEACQDFLEAKKRGNSEADEYLSKYCR